VATEHQRIARLRARYASESAEVQLGIGDDCAVLRPSVHPEVWTIDVAVEGTHFRRDRMPLDAIGFRAFMAAASDVAAMGARGKGALSSLVLPASFTDDELDLLCEGVARASSELGIPVIGGNLARGSELSLTTSVLGEAYGEGAVTRGGARPGQRVFVTGRLGASALGLACLLSDDDADDAAPFRAAFLSPRARLDCARAIADHASSAIDISDGLAQDATHVAEASDVTLELSWPSIPVAPDLPTVASRHQKRPTELVLAGGEDYELLFTADEHPALSTFATPIGRVLRGPAQVVVLDRNGEPLALTPGFDHFRGA
jgi:thiamine-monophosphate kinase